MKILGIATIYAKPKTSIPNKEHPKYPYLLKGVKIVRSDQVRSTDITYIQLPGGYVFLMAIIDWYSRKIIARDLSVTMDKDFCCSLLRKALTLGHPEIFNTDQGSQFTSREFVGILEESKVKVSMDGVSRCYDNSINERLWRTIKQDNIYLMDYQTPCELYEGLSKRIEYYNTERLHSYGEKKNDYYTPDEVYYGIIKLNQYNDAIDAISGIIELMPTID